MGPPGTRDTAATRRRCFALAAVGGLVSTMIIAVTLGAHSTTAPRAGDSASRTAAAARATSRAPAPGSPAAKASAEDALSGGAAADAPPPQPLVSHAAKTPSVRIVRYHGYQ